MTADNKLLDAYLQLALVPDKSPEKEKVWWAFDEMYDVVRKQPERAWLIICSAAARPLSAEEKCYFAAGPVEDFLVYHGVDYIEKVEQEAISSNGFNDLLGGVWQNTIGDEIWSRIMKVRRNVW